MKNVYRKSRKDKINELLNSTELRFAFCFLFAFLLYRKSSSWSSSLREVYLFSGIYYVCLGIFNFIVICNDKRKTNKALKKIKEIKQKNNLPQG